MDVSISAEDTSSVFPDTGLTDGAHDVVDGSQRVRIKPIDTKLQLHFKQTQASESTTFDRLPCVSTNVLGRNM